MRRFGASPGIIGKSLTLNGTSYTVVGVIPSDLRFYGQFRDIFTPIGQWNDPSFRDRRIDMSAHAFGRLKPGVTLPQAQADMDGVARDLAATYPEADKDVGVTLVSMKEDVVGKGSAILVRAPRRRRLSALDCVCERRQSASGALHGSLARAARMPPDQRSDVGTTTAGACTIPVASPAG